MSLLEVYMRSLEEVKAELWKHLDMVTVTLDEMDCAEELSPEEEAKLREAQKALLAMSKLTRS